MNLQIKEQLSQRANVIKNEVMAAANTAYRVGSLLYDIIQQIGEVGVEELRDYFISKTDADEAAGRLTMNKGIVAHDDGDDPSVDAETIEADNINVSGDVSVDGNSHVGSSTVDGNQTVGGTSTVANGNVTGDLNVGGTIETTNLQVNGTAHFWEVVIDKISSVGGSAMFTPADGFKLDHFSNVGTTGKKLYWQGGNGSVNMWAVGDMALCYKNVSGNQIYWWALVTAVGSETANDKTYHYIVISSDTDDMDGTIELAEGADVVQCGHKRQSNETQAQAAARQGAVYVASSNSLDRGLVAPLIAKYEGINDFNLAAFRTGYQAQNGSKFVGNFEIVSGSSTVPLDEYIGSHQPYIGTDKYWYVWDLSTNQYKKSVLAEGAPGTPGDDGVTPHIGDNGNWWIGNLDTGVSAKGDPGTPGDNGTSVTIVDQSVTYGVNNSGTVKPTTWQTNVPTTSAGQYLWTRTMVTYSDGTTTTSYSVSYHGQNGATGITYYTWIKYADTAQGGGLSDDPTGKEYIGFAYNKTTATESTNPSDYRWSLIRGEQGVPGEPGDDGTTYYTWIKYSDVLSPTLSSQIYDTPKSTTIAIGIAVNKTTATEGTNPSAYTWSRFKGEQGVPGNDGDDAVNIVINPTHLVFSLLTTAHQTSTQSATIKCYKKGVEIQNLTFARVGSSNCTYSITGNSVSITVDNGTAVQSISGVNRYFAPSSGYAEVSTVIGGVTYYIVIDWSVDQQTAFHQIIADETAFKATYSTFVNNVNSMLEEHSAQLALDAESIRLAVSRQSEYSRQNLASDPLYRGDIFVKDASVSEHIALEGTFISGSYGTASLTNQTNSAPPFPELDNLCYRLYVGTIPTTTPSTGATLYGRYANKANRFEVASGRIYTISLWIYCDREDALDSSKAVSNIKSYATPTADSSVGTPINILIDPTTQEQGWSSIGGTGLKYKRLGVVNTITSGSTTWKQVAASVQTTTSVSRYIEVIPYVNIHRPSVSPYRLNLYYSEWRIEDGEVPSTDVFSNNVERNLFITGIDILHRLVRVTSDTFMVQNNSGERTFNVNQYGDIEYAGTAITQSKEIDFSVQADKDRYFIQGIESNRTTSATLLGFDAVANDGLYVLKNAPSGTKFYLPCLFETNVTTQYTRVMTRAGGGDAHYITMKELRGLVGRRIIFINEGSYDITVDIGAVMLYSDSITTSATGYRTVYLSDDNGFYGVFPASMDSGNRYYLGDVRLAPGKVLILEFSAGYIYDKNNQPASTLGYYWRRMILDNIDPWVD